MTRCVDCAKSTHKGVPGESPSGGGHEDGQQHAAAAAAANAVVLAAAAPPSVGMDMDLHMVQQHHHQQQHADPSATFVGMFTQAAASMQPSEPPHTQTHLPAIGGLGHHYHHHHHHHLAPHLPELATAAAHGAMEVDARQAAAAAHAALHMPAPPTGTELQAISQVCVLCVWWWCGGASRGRRAPMSCLCCGGVGTSFALSVIQPDGDV
jgi:hypothetical protein